MEDKRARREVRELLVKCQNECGEVMAWGLLRESHRCPNELVSCTFGCAPNLVVVKRKDLNAHAADPAYALPHAVAPLRRQIDELKASHDGLAMTVATLQEELASLRQSTSSTLVSLTTAVSTSASRSNQCAGYRESQAIVRIPGQPLATVVLRYDRWDEVRGQQVSEVVDLKLCAGCNQPLSAHLPGP